ncbi:mandelate racemase/muconate lactonizing enzyme family protein [Nocardioides sp.]|jgi:L-alanine-DL-glutamate epimerase-like enolase superfamily enzyme|uniref:mandelate racemase/muconate lactonizing enzyme family protein n=1 Tax=Nocardioides sp. TaxID=35761 RepID=UPI002BD3FC0D|nr:mandelate racemase/muconate lactonizing enzyme family protein [Nocardioides sp.]HVX53378.1 mandelate racemase/muconate lactonizing enzyme family protein [Nocardioides sp.]
MTERTIVDLTTRLLSPAMPRPWVPADPRMHVIVVTVTDSDGGVGTGFSWTPTIGRSAIQAMLEEDIRSFVVGQAADPLVLWDATWEHLHEAGGGGVTTIALAGLDLALWDLEGHRTGRSVSELVGRRHDSLPAYGSGVNFDYSIDELADQAQRWVDAGFSAVKIKVGKPDLREDVDRVRAVREIIGPDRRLMVDANQRWDLDTALKAIAALTPLGLDWVEEPLRSEDGLGYRTLAGRIDVPIAMGENVHTIHRFRELAEWGAAKILQPNVIRVGGITPFASIAQLAQEYDVVVMPHVLADISGQLAAAIKPEVLVECVEDADFESLGILASPSPVQIRDGLAHVGTAAGLGLDFA